MASDEISIKVSDVDADPLEELDGIDFKINGNLFKTANKIVQQVVRLQFGIVTLPLNLLPAKPRYYAKNTLHEGFLVVRSLVDDVANSIDAGLTRGLDKDKTKAGL